MDWHRGNRNTIALSYMCTFITHFKCVANQSIADTQQTNVYMSGIFGTMHLLCYISRMHAAVSIHPPWLATRISFLLCETRTNRKKTQTRNDGCWWKNWELYFDLYAAHIIGKSFKLILLQARLYGIAFRGGTSFNADSIDWKNECAQTEASWFFSSEGSDLISESNRLWYEKKCGRTWLIPICRTS